MECPDSSSEYSEDLQDYDYYDDSVDNVCENIDDDSVSTVVNDPEFVEYSCLHTGQVDTLLKTEIDEITNSLSTIPSLAKLLLHLHGWNIEKIKKEFSVDPKRFLLQNGVVVAEKCSTLPNSSNCDETMMLNAMYTTAQNVNNVGECSICCESSTKALISLNCGHLFCRNCWQHHMETQLQNGVSTKIECMSTDCRLICPEYFALNIIAEKPLLKSKYEEMVFRDFVVSHPHLRWCPGRNCITILYCKTMKAHRVTCTSCNTKFCFLCGQNYHAPASCDIIKKWLIKCADDSETANYISAHTKDCPNCHSCIEKNGGCNHMQCSKCKFHFCWMCFRDWKSHGSEYYECSRYKENPAIAQEANYLKARRALEKYLHYYERFENHSKSLKMEEELRVKIKTKIEEKISRHEGTWIDWQYLHSASHLLTKCRYTLQYTYPFAYYIEPSARKELFEYQQAQLEKEIEELSWKVERAETTDRGELENQMHIAEQKRRTLLQDFFN